MGRSVTEDQPGRLSSWTDGNKGDHHLIAPPFVASTTISAVVHYAWFSVHSMREARDLVGKPDELGRVRATYQVPGTKVCGMFTWYCCAKP